MKAAAVAPLLRGSALAAKDIVPGRWTTCSNIPAKQSEHSQLCAPGGKAAITCHKSRWDGGYFIGFDLSETVVDNDYIATLTDPVTKV
ncbi:uncharacterized protein ColSpa_04176 [Colletotrichum spaethianum]|uniref:Uncharacterized protein n=1 Tax=Colletotrichum spaethianum TaxID=700344 RepID=A0AA37LCD2_9PEZI|nr:uncharacterized protein ColSpa_04176 [Colletotrichum spaethianum]GKT43995.1 hypothetical protein ColSpa_04176 [Colletotrichum spaethianum]